MSYRLLALDLDGTLLRSDQRVDDDDVAAIAELQANGVTVTIVTGRLQSGSLGAAAACAIDGVIACCEGSHLVELVTNTTVHHHAIETDLCALLRTQFGAHRLAGFVFDAQGIHHDHAGAPYAQYVSTWSPNLRVVEEELAWQTEPLAAVAIGEHDEVAAAAAIVAEHGQRLFSVSFPLYSRPEKSALLVRAAGPTKGTALTELCRRIGCTPAEAVAVGDWVNDIPMFEVAGRSFAMGGAPDAVRGAATDVLVRTAGAGGGIAEAIRRAWG
ncbi:MAG: HAD hydrolase family protein [Deltaproteobacteria bacterium]|nr:HAD hydrolase family protein [Deltaproteobacteria bacterium]